MKKVLWALCAVMMLALSACNKDNPNPENVPGGGGEGGGSNPPVQTATGEGVFNPAQRLISIAIDGTTSEEWEWANDVLTTILTADENGNLVESSWFEYDNHRIVSMTGTLEGMPVEVGYTYSGDKLAAVSVYSGPLEVLNIAFTHNAAGKPSHLTLEINETLLAFLPQLFGDGFPDIFNSKSTIPSKWEINSTVFTADLAWQGDNVAQVIFNGQININATLGEIRQMANLDSLLGSYASYLSLLGDSTVMPISVTMNDTSDFTYDNKNNPFYGFLGRLDPTVLSANNVTASDTRVSVNLATALDLSFMTIPLSFPLPVPVENGSQTYSYTYNAAGFPETVTDGDGSTTQYTYQQ
ncbi:MAG: hypothetical protein IJ524_01125 [Bacteroidales bacterium]|nr:hypothetical protein [Bacteroidales bacterium]